MAKSDYDRIYQEKLPKSFGGTVEISFHDGTKMLKVEALRNLELPSEIARKKIDNLIYKKTRGIINYNRDPIESAGTLSELKNIAENIQNDYRMADLHYILEKKSYKINIRILNKGKEYIEDGMLRLSIDQEPDLIIADRILKKPPTGIQQYVSPEDPNSDEYPIVISENNKYLISQTLGDIRHLVPVDAFIFPLRITVLSKIVGHVIEVRCDLHAKNLIKPIEETLKIEVV